MIIIDVWISFQNCTPFKFEYFPAWNDHKYKKDKKTDKKPE